MNTADWLDDGEICAAYGSATLKYQVAAALVAARQQHQLTQAALATLTGVSQAYIARLERGDANPTLGQIGALLAAMGCTAAIHLRPIVPLFPGDDPAAREDARG
jgi:transcriptional regulator with XRE-family HTH domain